MIDSVAYGIWLDHGDGYGDWLQEASGVLFWTANRGVAEARRRQLLDRGTPGRAHAQDPRVAVFGQDGRPIFNERGPSERKAILPITPDPSTMGRRS